MDASLPQSEPEAALPEVMTIEQVAQLLHLHRTTVSDMCESGMLRARDVGSGRYRRWRISRDAVQQFLNRPDDGIVL